MRAAASRLPLALFPTLPVPAHAHLINSGLGPFYNGTLHLLLSPGHLLAVLAVGLLAGQSGKASARGSYRIAGRALGTVADLGWPQVPLLTLLGVLVAAGVRLSAVCLVSPAAVTGLIHGIESASALAASGSLAVAGTAAAVLIPTLLTAALAVSLRVAWTRIALRVSGSWIAAVGMLMQGGLLQGTS